MVKRSPLGWLYFFMLAAFLFVVAFTCIGAAAYPWLLGYR